MIEKTVLDYLSGNLDYPVYMEHPVEKPDRYVVIERTGSTTSNLVEHAVLAIQSCAESLYYAAALNESVKEAMEHITDDTEVMAAKLNTDYNYTNTAKKQYRYQAVYQVN